MAVLFWLLYAWMVTLKCFEVKDFKCSKEKAAFCPIPGCKPLNDHKKFLNICSGIFMVFSPYAM